jgi:hypothetical protein
MYQYHSIENIRTRRNLGTINRIDDRHTIKKIAGWGKPPNVFWDSTDLHLFPFVL